VAQQLVELVVLEQQLALVAEQQVVEPVL